MKKSLLTLIFVILMSSTLCAYAADDTNVIQVSKEFVPQRVLTADGSLWLEKKAVENTYSNSDICKTFPWLRRYEGVNNIVGFSGDAAIDKDGNVWLVTVGNTVKHEKTEITNAKKILYHGSEYSVILKRDGTLCTYRFKLNSSFFPYTEYSYDERGYDINIDNVVDIVSYHHGILALKKDGTVWGVEAGGLRPYALAGGISRHKTDKYPLDNIVSVFADGGVAIACASDGSVYSLYGGAVNFGEQHSGNRIDKLPIRDVKCAFLGTWNSIFVKKDGTAWFVGYPKYDDFDIYYKSIEAGTPTHTDEYISEITQLNINNIKLVWENGLVKSNNTFWVIGRDTAFYDSVGNRAGRVNPQNIDVACLTDEDESDVNSDDVLFDDNFGSDNTTSSDSSSNQNESDDYFSEVKPDPKDKFPWENNAVAVPIKGNKEEEKTEILPEDMTDEQLEYMIKNSPDSYKYCPSVNKVKGVRNNSNGSSFYFQIGNKYDFPLSGKFLFPLFDENLVCREFLVYEYYIPADSEIEFNIQSELKWANVEWDGFWMYFSDNIDIYGAEMQSRWYNEFCLGLFRKQQDKTNQFYSFVLDTQYLSQDELDYIRDAFKRNFDIVYEEYN